MNTDIKDVFDAELRELVKYKYTYTVTSNCAIISPKYFKFDVAGDKFMGSVLYPKIHNYDHSLYMF
jgi:hypothetical protein